MVTQDDLLKITIEYMDWKFNGQPLVGFKSFIRSLPMTERQFLIQLQNFFQEQHSKFLVYAYDN